MTRLRTLESRLLPGASPTSDQDLLGCLTAHGALDRREMSAFQDLLEIVKVPGAGATVDPPALSWLVQMGPELLKLLDAKIASLGPVT